MNGWPPKRPLGPSRPCSGAGGTVDGRIHSRAGTGSCGTQPEPFIWGRGQGFTGAEGGVAYHSPPPSQTKKGAGRVLPPPTPSFWGLFLRFPENSDEMAWRASPALPVPNRRARGCVDLDPLYRKQSRVSGF